MSRFDVQGATLVAERLVPAARGQTQPGAFGVMTIFVRQAAVQNQNFLAARMIVRLVTGAGPPARQTDPLGPEGMQFAHRRTVRGARAPAVRPGRIDGHADAECAALAAAYLDLISQDQPVKGDGNR